MIETFPLRWPAGWPRTEQRAFAKFSTDLDMAKLRLERELRLLGARSIVLTTCRPRRKDGYLAVNQPMDLDPSACVWFTLDGAERAIPCDKWNRLKDNIHAIELTVAALRGLERWGAKEMVNAAFAGFAALPSGAGAADDDWWTVLEVSRNDPLVVIDAAYRSKAKQHHPDRGGDVEQWHRVDAAYRRALQEVGG